jgi:hypothetical protein
VIVFDKGDTRARDKRQLQIILAERGTGFTLWRDVVDNLSDYKSIASTFQTLYISSDHRQMAGLSFDSHEAAANFLYQIETITSDPLNIALSAPKRDKLARKAAKLAEKIRKSAEKEAAKQVRPKKCDISSPCLFQHVTSVDMTDFDRLFSMASLMNRTDVLDPSEVPPPSGQRSSLRRLGYSAINVNLPTSYANSEVTASSAPSPVSSSTNGSSYSSNASC